MSFDKAAKQFVFLSLRRERRRGRERRRELGRRLTLGFQPTRACEIDTNGLFGLLYLNEILGGLGIQNPFDQKKWNIES